MAIPVKNLFKIVWTIAPDCLSRWDTYVAALSFEDSVARFKEYSHAHLDYMMVRVVSVEDTGGKVII